MQGVSAEFLRVLAGSHTPVVRVDAWLAGKLLMQNVPLVSGSLQVTKGQAIRSRLTATFANPDGVLTLKPGSPLAAFGAELHVQAGVMIGPVPEWLSLGWFPIMSVEMAGPEQWRTYSRPEEPGVVVGVDGGTAVNVECVDRAQVISESRFMAREQPTGGTVLGEIGRLLRGVVPWTRPLMVDRAVPSDLTYDDDRLGAVVKLAAAMDCDLIMTENGVATLVPQIASGPAVFSMLGGPGGTKVSFTRKISRDKLWNAVVVRSADVNKLPLQGVATVVTGPLRFDGPLKRIPFFASLPVLTTQDQVMQAARTRMATLAAERAQTVTVTGVANYGIQCGDIGTVGAPKGQLSGVATAVTFPLVPGPMQITMAVDPLELAEVG